jgi:hypothetical protein
MEMDEVRRRRLVFHVWAPAWRCPGLRWLEARALTGGAGLTASRLWRLPRRSRGRIKARAAVQVALAQFRGLVNAIT